MSFWERIVGIFKRNYVGQIEWEEIKPVGGNAAPQYMRRAKVVGGWLVETASHASSSGGLTFLPDPEYKWELSKVE